MRLALAVSFPLMLALAPACGGSDAGTDGDRDDAGRSNTGHDAGTGGAKDGGGGGGSDGGDVDDDDPNGARTLKSCKTDIAADVPEFYRRYFRCVTVTKTANGVSITTENLPPHLSYYYGSGNPNYAPFDTSRGPQYHPNPNTLQARSVTLAIPDAPTSLGLTITSGMVDRQMNTNRNEYRPGPAGVALDSVAVFNDQAAPGDDIDNELYTFDSYNAHPTPQGEYHYHTATPGPLEVLKSIGATTSTTPGSAAVELYGIMCDGALVLGCTELDGKPSPTSGLDAQNGHVGDIVDKDGTVHFTARYHTHVCPMRYTTHKYTPEIQYYQGCGR